MNSSELIEIIEDFQKIEKDNYFLDSLDTLSDIWKEFSEEFFQIINTNPNALLNTRNNLDGILRDKIAKIKNEISSYKFYTGGDGFLNGLSKLIDKFDEMDAEALSHIEVRIRVLLQLYEIYIKNYDLTDTIFLLDKANELAVSIATINDLLVKIQMNIQNLPENIPPEIRFTIKLNSISDFNEFSIKINSLNDLNFQLCHLFKINEIENHFQIIKVETGTLIADVVGNPVVIGFIIYSIKKFVEYLHRNFTKEGKIASMPRKVEDIDRIIGLRNKLTELGIETKDIDENIKHATVKISSDLYNILKNEPIIKLQNEIISVGDQLADKFLEEAKTMYLEEGDKNLNH